MKLDALVLILAAVLSFGYIVPDYYLCADDQYRTIVLNRIENKGDTLGDKLWLVVWHAEAGGHFKPALDVVTVIAHHFARWEWARWVLAFYVLLHLVSAWLLRLLLFRLRAPPALALGAAVLFLVHPVVDEALTCTAFGNNVPGLFFSLAACLLWMQSREPAPSGSWWRLTAGGVCLFVAIGFNPSFIVAGPLLLAFSTLVVLRRADLWRTLGKCLLVGTLFLGLALGLRYQAYGTLTTTKPEYQELEIRRNPVILAKNIASQMVLLEQSASMAFFRDRNLPAFNEISFARPLVSWESLLILVAAGGFAAIVVRRRETEGERAESRGGLIRGMAFGLAIMVAMYAPYYLFVGSTGINRYIHPAAAGAAALALLLVGAIARLFFRWRRIVLLIVLIPCLFVLLRTSREASRSMAYAHEASRLVFDAIVEDLRDEPEVSHVYLLTNPLVVGRSGHLLPYEGQMRGVVEVRLGRPFSRGRTRQDASYAQDRFQGALTLPLPADTAVYLVRDDARSIERLSRVDEVAAPEPVAVRLWHQTQWIFGPRMADQEVLDIAAGASPVKSRMLLNGLAGQAGQYRRYLAVMMVNDFVSPFDAETGEARYTSFASPMVMAELLKVLALTVRTDLVREARITLRWHAESPAVAKGFLHWVGGLPEHPALALLAWAAALEADLMEPVIEVVAKVAPDRDTDRFREIAEQERRAFQLAIDGTDAAAAAKALDAARRSWGSMHVWRPDLRLAALRCLLAAGAPAEDLEKARADLPRPLKALADTEAAALAAFREQGKAGFALELEATLPGIEQSCGTKTTIPVLATIRNRGGLHLPGGRGPFAGRVHLRCIPIDAEQPVMRTRTAFLLDEGVSAGAAVAIPLPIAAPAEPGTYRISLELEAYGQSLASKVVIPAFEVVAALSDR